MRMIKAVKLLGSNCVVSGLSPELARMTVASGIAFEDIEMYRSLRDAIRPAIREAGLTRR